MSKKPGDTFDRLLSSVPVDSTAARQMRKGVHYEVAHKPGDIAHWETPPLMRRPLPRAENLTGTTFGRFRVLGLHAGHSAQGTALWVCRCVCGHYEVRRARAIKNPANAGDMCLNCRKQAHLFHRRTP